MASANEMKTISHRRIDDEARRMMVEGVTLTHEQADEIGDEGCDWLRTRLHLTSETTEDGIEFAATERCPVCGEAMPAAKRDRRVASNGAAVCGKASCEERAGDLHFRIVGNLPIEIDSEGYDTYSAASGMIEDLEGDFRIEAYR